ncbi:MAG: bifunctional phosphoribosylaminoimidazolecarboxamide formyltransferase/IMP cyclohydrolase [bacterium]|nr:bifunctional phosphoribosylaminoimidazolecarboxamide formyltransferase/IMP cyclohydrolase [bacterium]
MIKKIKSALISVFNKDGLEEIVKLLNKHSVKIISTGGTAEFIRKLGVEVTLVEELTEYPSLFEGRVKTLHPKIAGGILKIRGNKVHEEEAKKYDIPEIDLVVSNLYPFENTVASGAAEEKIIEDIDIGGISLIREASKNFKDVVIISSADQYEEFKKMLEKGAETTLEERKKFAGAGFETTSLYDSAIREYFQGTKLRYGENPHQRASFVGNLLESFEQLHGKELSYNNLIDTEAAIAVVYDFDKPAFAIIKHMNACGLAVREEGKLLEAYQAAYDADPVSAFGGILAANRTVSKEIAELIKEQKLFVEVIIAPSFSEEALAILREKKDCRILRYRNPKLPERMIQTSFTGFLIQDRDTHVESEKNLTVVTKRKPTEQEKKDLLMATVATKHLKSNSIALTKDGTLISMGCGQTSRIDALKQAIEKFTRIAKLGGAKNPSLSGAVMSSEAFFPFPDCVELAAKAGVSAVIHPGGSKNDQASTDMADRFNMAMVTTGFRHFKH